LLFAASPFAALLFAPAGAVFGPVAWIGFGFFGFVFCGTAGLGFGVAFSFGFGAGFGFV
jgi:hypothetical protein